jgi:hypothetical protein
MVFVRRLPSEPCAFEFEHAHEKDGVGTEADGFAMRLAFARQAPLL